MSQDASIRRQVPTQKEAAQTVCHRKRQRSAKAREKRQADAYKFQTYSHFACLNCRCPARNTHRVGHCPMQGHVAKTRLHHQNATDNCSTMIAALHLRIRAHRKRWKSPRRGETELSILPLLVQPGTAIDVGAVSYTHLTLPTILLV